MKSSIRHTFNKAVTVTVLFCMVAQPAFAALPPPVGLNLAQEPLFIGSAVPPMVMLNVPKDHQMFGKLYNDFTDVDGKEGIETNYEKTIDYYGYFDPFKCYTYVTNLSSTGRGGFEPKGPTDTDHYCTAGANEWSGNFLNWVSMTRLDAVRKLLYGGFRAVDNVALTILERAAVPTDSHSWAKHYRKDDLNRLTPFSDVSPLEVRATSNTPSLPRVQTTIKIQQITRVGDTVTIAVDNAELARAGVALPPLNVDRVNGNVVANSITVEGVAGATNSHYNGDKLVTATDTTTPGVTKYSFVTASSGDNLSGAAAGYLSAQTPRNWDITQPLTGRKFLEGDMVTVRGDSNDFIKGVIVAVSGLSGLVTLRIQPQQFSIDGTLYSARRAAAGTSAPGTPFAVSSLAFSRWRLINHSSPGITICNTTSAVNSGITSHLLINTSTYPPVTNSNGLPLMRVAHGDYGLWAVANGKMCQWSGNNNNNNYSGSELTSSAWSPVQSRVGLPLAGMAAPDYTVRVRVCEDGKIGEKEKCLKYDGTANWKPVGLLQQYSSSNRKLIQFGLMTPTYHKNKSGGVLRKQIGFLDERSDFQAPYAAKATDELDPTTGQFRQAEGIIKTLNSIQMHGYAFGTTATNAGLYSGCSFGLVNPAEDKCNSWGNPTSEMYIETLRYLAGKGAPSEGYIGTSPAGNDFDYGGLDKDKELNMKVQGWNVPLTNANWCAPLNVIVMNASVSSYDSDQIPTDLFNGETTARKETTRVGIEEGLGEGKLVMAGKLGTDPITTKPHPVNDAAAGLGLCTPKKLGADSLADVLGICPEAPMLSGSYLMAGAASWARDNKIIPELSRAKGGSLPPGDVISGRVNTYGITLSGAAPKITIPVPGTGGKQVVTILPSGRTLTSATEYAGTGAIVDFKAVRQNPKIEDDGVNNPGGTGKFFVSWEDSMQGNDYDLDTWGIIEYEFLPRGGPYTQVKVTTDVISGITSLTMGFGYVISGVTKGRLDGAMRPDGISKETYGEGAHYTSAHRGTNNTGAVVGPAFFWPPADMTIGGIALKQGDECGNPPNSLGCDQNEGPRSITFNLTAAGAATIALEDPLYYAAKYGGYKDHNRNGKRDDREWDSRVQGVPDNYFLVTNPARLEEALEQSFISILAQASASSVATNSTSLQTDSAIYQARFNTNDWSGQVLAFKINKENGTIAAGHSWDAGDQLRPAVVKPDERMILTYNAANQKGVPFTMTDAPAELKTFLYTAPGGTADPVAGVECTGSGPAGLLPAGCTRLGALRLAYLRGDGSNEGSGGGNFRPRPVTKLGDIVNSNPNFVGAPNAGHADQDYAGFRLQNKDRRPMIYVGANDGMLHAFSVNESGKEYFGYIPTRAWPNLTALTDKAYKHRYIMDGSPEVSDAFVSMGSVNSWRTVLVSGMGAGGQGVFALDVTKPDSFLDPVDAVKNVMWEFTDRDDPNLGYVMGQPVIRRMYSNPVNYPNGRWAVIFSAGYNNSEGTAPNPSMPNETSCANSETTPPVSSTPLDPRPCTTSTTGHGYLFVLFLDGPGSDGKWDLGTDYIRISTGVGTPDNPNGLAAPFAADVNADGKVDFVYAGDLRGHMFKFDVRDPSPATWANPSNRVVLFQATVGDPPQTQPITAKAEGTLHPSGTGFIITFGTGKYLEPRDPEPAASDPKYALQSFYGIWDKNDSTTTISAQSVATARKQLLEQTIDTVEATIPADPEATPPRPAQRVNFRVVSEKIPGVDGVPDWSEDQGAPPADANAGTAIMGWYMDFPKSKDTGERSVFRPILTAGRLLFSTLIPNPAKCEAGGTSFLMVVDPGTGGRINSPVLDTSGNGELNASDKIAFGDDKVFASGVESAIGITPTPTIVRSDTGGLATTTGGAVTLLGTRGPLIAGAGFLLAYALAAGSSGGNSSTMIGLAAMGGRVSWRELLSD